MFWGNKINWFLQKQIYIFLYKIKETSYLLTSELLTGWVQQDSFVNKYYTGYFVAVIRLLRNTGHF